VNDPGVGTNGQEQAPGAADEVAQEIIAAGGVAVADRNSVIDGADAIAAHAVDEFGRIDIVVNNAGISGGGAFDEMPAADFDRLVDTHYGGAVRVSRAAWPHLKAADAGRIVNMSSASVFGTPFTSPYVSSKAGIFGLTRALAAEGAFSGILVNAVMPAAFTRMTAQLPDDDFRSFLETYFPPDKVAPFVVFLAHQSTTINGETFSVGADRAARVFLAECPGVVSDGTPEGFAAQADELLSIEGWEIPSDMMDEVRYSSDHLGPEVAAAYARVAGHHTS
jgi:NAD(P)-dependent dehydrogenase (short-subunit alcohol dehydrogenase family)